jgi:hypothetical protein
MSAMSNIGTHAITWTVAGVNNAPHHRKALIWKVRTAEGSTLRSNHRRDELAAHAMTLLSIEPRTETVPLTERGTKRGKK